MQSILSKILGLLLALNIALWLFVFISDDFVPNQVDHKREELNLSALFYAQIALPILVNENLSEFQKKIELERVFTTAKIPNYEQINIYRYQEEGSFQEWHKYFVGQNATPPKPIAYVCGSDGRSCQFAPAKTAACAALPALRFR